MTDWSKAPRIAPSKAVDHFRGTRREGARLTDQQITKAKVMAAQMARNQTRYGLPSEYVVRVMVEPESLDAPPTWREHPCPVMGVTKDRTRLNVIAPDGVDIWVPWEKSR